jgi:hypothetical protein
LTGKRPEKRLNLMKYNFRLDIKIGPDRISVNSFSFLKMKSAMSSISQSHHSKMIGNTVMIMIKKMRLMSPKKSFEKDDVPQNV